MNDFLKLVYEAIDEKHGADIQIIDISKISSLADYFIIANANNTPQLQAIIENIDFKMSKAGFEPLGIEGNRNGGWNLIDYGHTVIHIFGKEERNFYDLEKLWVDGELVIPAV